MKMKQYAVTIFVMLILLMSCVLPDPAVAATEADCPQYSQEQIGKRDLGDIETDTTVSSGRPAVVKIEIKTLPEKTVYQIGETLNTAGLTLAAIYNDGNVKSVSSGFTVSGFDGETAGVKTVTVTYKEKTATFTVTVQGDQTVTVVSQPESVTAQTGDTVTFTVVAEGSGLSYKWQYSNDGKQWINTSLSGYNTATLTVSNVRTDHHGRQYRCIVADSSGNTVISEAATLFVPCIANQPKTTWVDVNTNAKFTVNYTVSEGVTYQWQYKGNTASSTWNKTTMAGNKTNTLTVPAIATRNGYQYRCIINDNGNTITTNAAILYIQAPEAVITKQPEAASAVSGNTVQFSIAATGEGLTYQWQWSDDGENWSSTRGTGYATPTLTVKTNNYNGGRLYRCCVKTVNGSAYNKVYSDPALMTVLPAAEITQPPQSVTVQVGENATFHVEAEGEGLSYQWQWAKFLGNWKNTTMSGATTDTLTVSDARKEMNGRYYRVIITNKYTGTVTTQYCQLLVR